MLFGFDTDGSRGGLNDQEGSFDEILEAVDSVKGTKDRYSNYQLFDRVEGIEVEDFEERLN